MAKTKKIGDNTSMELKTKFRNDRFTERNQLHTISTPREKKKKKLQTQLTHELPVSCLDIKNGK